MKHECKCTTCDRCGKRMDGVFATDSIWGINVELKEIECRPNLEDKYLVLQAGAKEFEERSTIWVRYEGRFREKKYSLCYSCAKELKEFFKASNEGKGECDVRCDKTHCKLISD